MSVAVAFDEPHLNPPVFRLGDPEKFIAIAPDGAVIVADTMGDQLLRVDPSGTNQITTYITSAQLSGAGRCPRQPAGRLQVRSRRLPVCPGNHDWTDAQVRA